MWQLMILLLLSGLKMCEFIMNVKNDVLGNAFYGGFLKICATHKTNIMAQRPWIFMINTFEVNTRSSNRKMLSLVTDTHAKLSVGNADPDIQALFALLDPIYNNYRQICIDFDVVAGNRQGGTLAFENVMAQIPAQLRIWEAGVRAIHFEDTPEERAIFPNKRGPFQSGTYEERLSAIGSLAQKLSTIPALASTRAQVQSFYNMALGTRVAQQQDEGALASMSDLRENERVLVADTLYGILGSLMFKYRSDRRHIDNYFDLTLLRSKAEVSQQLTVSGTLRHAVTSAPLANALVTLTLADGQRTMTTDLQGNFEFRELELDESEEAEVTFSLSGFTPRTELLTLVPGEDQVVDSLLMPQSIPTPPPPTPTPPPPAP